MTKIPETRTIHKDPRAAGVTPDASAEYTNGIMSKLKFIFDIAFIADAGNIGAAFGRIAETWETNNAEMKGTQPFSVSNLRQVHRVSLKLRISSILTYPIAPITNTLATAEADAMSTDVIASDMIAGNDSCNFYQSEQRANALCGCEFTQIMIAAISINKANSERFMYGCELRSAKVVHAK